VPIQHVVLIVMENNNYGSVIGPAPYITGLAKKCGVETAFQAVTHPSLPNYLALSSGSTHGVTDDADPSAHPIGGASIFSVVAAARLTWRTYAESMPGNCALVPASPYAVKHNPATYYAGLRSQCRAWDVPLGTTSSGPLAGDLAHGVLPAFTLVDPNLCNDMHDCSVATGDAWLAHWLPRIFSSTPYLTGTTAVFLTWDEGAGSLHVPLVVASPSVPRGTVVGTAANHYSLLRTMAAALGLSAASLGSAAHATSLLAAFRLRPR
jgi:phosphatidylinositol-3-phosphatase